MVLLGRSGVSLDILSNKPIYIYIYKASLDMFRLRVLRTALKRLFTWDVNMVVSLRVVTMGHPSANLHNLF